MEQPPSDPRAQNTAMIERIGNMPTQPFREGGYALRVIETPGRKSGLPRPTPIAITQVEGSHYLCSPDRERQWVRNLLGAGECRVLGEEPGQRRTTLVEGEEAAVVIKTYLNVLQLPFATEQFPVGADASIQQIAEHTRQTAVFRLQPSGE